MRSFIVLVCLMMSSISVVHAADQSCLYVDTSFTIDSHDNDCRFAPDDDSVCRFQASYSIASECRKEIEVFYVCQAVLEFSPKGLFSRPLRGSSETVGSVVMHDGRVKGVAKMLWKPTSAVKDVRVTHVNCYATETYPVDEQK